MDSLQQRRWTHLLLVSLPLASRTSLRLVFYAWPQPYPLLIYFFACWTWCLALCLCKVIERLFDVRWSLVVQANPENKQQLKTNLVTSSTEDLHLMSLCLHPHLRKLMCTQQKVQWIDSIFCTIMLRLTNSGLGTRLAVALDVVVYHPVTQHSCRTKVMREASEEGFWVDADADTDIWL